MVIIWPYKHHNQSGKMTVFGQVLGGGDWGWPKSA